MPAQLDVDTGRSCVDTALRLIGEDLRDKFSPAMERRFGSDWTRTARGLGEREVEPADPAFWFGQLLDPGSVPRQSFPGWHTSTTQTVRDARRLRNQHYHFAGSGRSETAHLLVQDLATLRSCANVLRLRCKAEVGELIEAVQRIGLGPVPETPTVSEVAHLSASHQRLSMKLEASLQQQTAKDEELDRQRDEVRQLQQQLAEQTAKDSEMEQRLRAAEANYQRVQQEADIAAEHHRQLEQQRSELVVSQQPEPQMPPLLGELLAHLYAGIVGTLVTVDGSLRMLTELLKSPDGRDLVGRVEAGEVLELGSELAAEARDLREDQVRLFEDLGVSSVHLDSMPSEEPFGWIVQEFKVCADLESMPRLASELATLDQDSCDVITDALRMREFCESIAGKAYSVAKRFAGLAVTTEEASAGVRWLEGGGTVAPGQPWPFERGDDVWVLSSTRRELRRPGSRPGRLRDQVGPERELELVEAFLKIRPEGGRIFVDADGDASTLIEGQLVYLGIIESTR